MVKGHVKSNVKPQHMEAVRSRVINSRVKPQVSHTCVNTKNYVTHDDIVPQGGAHDVGGSQQEVTLDSDTGMISDSHTVESTGPSGHAVSSVRHMLPRNSIVAGPQNLALLYDVSVDWDGKYLNTVLPKSVADIHKNRSPCKVFQEWRNQSNFDFGFIPLSHFIMPKNCEYVAPAVTCPFELYHKVKSSGHLNYMACRIPVRSQLNVRAWEEMTEGYWDTQLTHLIKFGFPLDFNRSCPLYSDHKNHSSALQYMSDVDAYLKEETHHGAILGPFDKSPIEGTHVSPFLTRDKSNSKNRRVIIDLSWPKHSSVNAGIDKNSYLGTDFALTFPSVDHITTEIKRLGTAAHIYKVDVSRAFRHIKLDPSDMDLLGLEWRDVTYVDTCLPFGARHGTQIFQRVSDAVRFGMRRRGYDVINYVDDFIGLGVPSVARASFDALRVLLRQLGLDVSQKKLIAPSTKAVCLGVEIDTVNRTISIPQEKLTKIHDMVNVWTSKHFCSMRQLQSLLGHLMYIQKCVKPSRFFVNRMLDLLRRNYDASSITLDHDFKRDLRWFQSFLSQYNGTSFFDHKPIHHVVELDACLVGLGGRCGHLVYHLPIVKHYANLTIVHLEMVNILVALRVFAHLWSKQRILVKCDNQAVVHVLTTGRTKDAFLAACARNIWLVSAQSDVELSYRHVMGRDNGVADLLSRWQNTTAQHMELQSKIGSHLWLNVSSKLLEINNEI